MMFTNNVRLAPCPHCGSSARLVDIYNGYAIVCNNATCLGEMRVKFGSCDDRELFLHKLVSDWNRRAPEIKAVTEGVERIIEYRDAIYEETQREYDEYGSCCVDVLDEVINILSCFTAFNYTEEETNDR